MLMLLYLSHVRARKRASTVLMMMVSRDFRTYWIDQTIVALQSLLSAPMFCQMGRKCLVL